MTLTIKRNLLTGATSPGPGEAWKPDFASVVAASLQAQWTGTPERIVIVVRGQLDGEVTDILSVLDTDAGYENGDIVNLDALPIGLEQIQAELTVLEGSAAVSLYIRARE